MITGLAHDAFRVADMDKALEFYCGVLGCTREFEIRDDAGNPHIVYLKVAHEQFLELFYGANCGRPASEGTPPGFCHLCLAVDDAKAEYERIKALWPIKTHLQMGKDTNWQFWVTDPDGNDLEFMQLMPTSPQYRCCHPEE